MKKYIVILLIIAILGSVGFLVFPAKAEAGRDLYLECSYRLKEAGIFIGTGSGFELGRAPTRIEGGIMLVRLLGGEKEAIENNYTHPFNDVPEWGDAYVGYLYKYGLTNGINSINFGSKLSLTAKQYMAFALRMLGFDEKNGDFEYNNSISFAKEVGIISDEIENDYLKLEFLRAHMAEVSLNVLQTKVKLDDSTLLESLLNKGSVEESVASFLEIPLKTEYSQMDVPFSIPVLTYHHIVSKEEKEQFFFDNDYVMSDEELNTHLDLIQAMGYKTITVTDLFYYKQCNRCPGKVVVITFDDGYAGTIDYAYPLLKQHNMVASQFIITSIVGRNRGNESFGTLTYLDWDDMINSLDVYTYHSHTDDIHRLDINNIPYAISKDWDVVYKDIEKSFDLLSSHGLNKCTAISFPYGAYNNDTLEMLDLLNGEIAFNTKDGYVKRNTDIYQIPRFTIKPGEIDRLEQILTNN